MFIFFFHDIHVCNEMGEKEQSVENKMNERIGQDKRERERDCYQVINIYKIEVLHIYIHIRCSNFFLAFLFQCIC